MFNNLFVTNTFSLYSASFTAVCSILLGFFVLLKNRHSQVNQSFFIFCLAIFGWLLGATVNDILNNKIISRWATTIGCSFANFTAPAFYHLIVSVYKKKSETIFIVASYIIMFLFAALFIFTDVFIHKTVHVFTWGYYAAVKPSYFIYLAFFFLIFFRSFYLLKKESKTIVSAIEKTRNKILLLSFGIVLLGSIDYIAKFGINVYPLGSIFALVFIIIVSFAILRHRLMDINVVIKKSFVYTFTIGLFTGIYLVGVFLLTRLIQNITGREYLLFTILTIILSSLLFQPLKNKINLMLDKLFFKSNYDYQTALQSLSKKVSTAATLDELNLLVSQAVNNTLKTNHAKIQKFN